MKIKTLFALAIIFLPAIGNATRYYGSVQVIQTPSEERPCVFFKLDTEGSPWFSFPVQQNDAYRDMSNVLVTARYDGRPVTVDATDGQELCGVTKINFIRF